MTDARRNYETTRDEFIADYLDRHGHNQATRTEAEDLADEWRDVARDAVQFARLAVKRAESVSDKRDLFHCALDAFEGVYSNEQIPSLEEAGYLMAAAIKLAMSEGES